MGGSLIGGRYRLRDRLGSGAMSEVWLTDDEELTGGTLAEWLAGEKPLPDAEASSIAAQIAAGLAHAHAQGLVHGISSRRTCSSTSC